MNNRTDTISAIVEAHPLWCALAPDVHNARLFGEDCHASTTRVIGTDPNGEPIEAVIYDGPESGVEILIGLDRSLTPAKAREYARQLRAQADNMARLADEADGAAAA